MGPVSSHPLKFCIRKCLSILIISSTYHGLVMPPYQLWLFLRLFTDWSADRSAQIRLPWSAFAVAN